MSYNLFLDDIRTVGMVYPNMDKDFIEVRSYDTCIAYIKENGLPEFMSFDNDLGEDENNIVLPDGFAVTKWLVYESGLDLTNFKFKVHSANPVAKKQIEGLLNNYIKFTKENMSTIVKDGFPVASLDALLEDFAIHDKLMKSSHKSKSKMKSTTSFQELAKLAMEQISKQQPTTYEKARAQFLRLENQGSTKSKKQANREEARSLRKKKKSL
ncbi:MAG: cyclic-phosphate processing receiver domain-containing protein [Bacteroidia bacterium]